MEDLVFKKYRKKQLQEMRPYVVGEKLPRCVSISQSDRDNGSPKAGDMIARNPQNHDDQWLVAEAFFRDNYETVETDELDRPENDMSLESLLEVVSYPGDRGCSGGHRVEIRIGHVRLVDQDGDLFDTREEAESRRSEILSTKRQG